MSSSLSLTATTEGTTTETKVFHGEPVLERHEETQVIDQSNVIPHKFSNINLCQPPKSFYEQVDELASSNSLEYPQIQAKYVEEWLANHEPTEGIRGGKDESCRGGNVIGIRGFATMYNGKRAEDLRNDYLKLRVKYRRLLSHFMSRLGDYFEPADVHDNEPGGQIKLLIDKRNHTCSCQLKANLCDACSGRDVSLQIEQQRGKLIKEIEELRMTFHRKDLECKSRMEELQSHTDRLAHDIMCKNSEIEKLEQQIRRLTLEPRIREITNLEQEQSYLTQKNSICTNECEQLKENCSGMIEKLHAVKNGHYSCRTEADSELNHFIFESFRLQVQAHKLKDILSTETQIKVELEKKMSVLMDEREKLRNEVMQQRLQLDSDRQRAQNHYANELYRLGAVMAHLRKKCELAKEERAARENELKSSKNRYSELELKLNRAHDSLQTNHQSELLEIKRLVDSLNAEKTKLREQLDKLELELKESKQEREQLKLDLLHSHRNSSSEEPQIDEKEMSNLERQTQQMQDLQVSIDKAEADCRCSRAELNSLAYQLDQSRKQYDELKRIYDSQSEAIAEATARRDKELAKLRADLNYEKYDKQVTVRNVERELKASLRELESLKCRFISRTKISHNPSK